MTAARISGDRRREDGPDRAGRSLARVLEKQERQSTGINRLLFRQGAAETLSSAYEGCFSLVVLLLEAAIPIHR